MTSAEKRRIQTKNIHKIRRAAIRHLRSLEGVTIRKAPSNKELFKALVYIGEVGNSQGYKRGLAQWYFNYVGDDLVDVEKIKRESKKKRKPKKKNVTTSEEFLQSWAWRTLRYKVLQKYGRRCMCCGVGPEAGVQICVDHIKPRSKYPELSLEQSNLQVLCGPCNQGKGAWDETDFRPKLRAV